MSDMLMGGIGSLGGRGKWPTRNSLKLVLKDTLLWAGGHHKFDPTGVGAAHI